MKHEPFKIDFTNINTQQQQQQNNNNNPANQEEDFSQHLKRTAKRVETLAKDNQLRKGTNLLLQDADQQEWKNRNNNLDSETVHEQKVNNLKS